MWLVAVEAVGLAAFPLAYYLFPQLTDRGYSVSKPLGILTIGYASWILSVLHILPSIWLTVTALFLVIACVSGKIFWGRRREISLFISRERAAILMGEAIFLVVFAGWILYRAYDPAIDHTEQPMDFAFLNATIRSSLGSPEDPWLRGEAVSYYYFGYWVMGILSKLTGIPSLISYNLSMALVPALGAVGIFGLVHNMVRSEVRRLRYALVGGIAASVLLVGGANLEGVFEFAHANGMGSESFWRGVQIEGLQGPAHRLSQSWKPEEFWWWWRASRVISTRDGDQVVDYTIEEFPFFSFILGDLHPHVMSIPFVLLFLTACWSYLSSPPLSWRRDRRRTIVTVVFLALALGGLAFTNMWDLPIFSAVFIGIVAVKEYAARENDFARQIRTAVPVILVVVGGALVLILPYLLTFTSQVSGIAPVVVATTQPLHLFIVWGIFLVAVTPFILSEFWQTTVDDDWARLFLLSFTVGFLPYLVWVFLQVGASGIPGDLLGRLLHVFPVALLVSVAVYTVLWFVKNGNVDRGRVFALVLSALGLLLVMGPELLYVDDGFGGASERMNTVFKLYYQGWIVFAAASGFAIYYWSTLRARLTGPKRLITTVWSVVFVALIAASAYYPVAAANSKGDLFHGRGASLDGLAYLSGVEYKAIDFVRENVRHDSAVLEAVGPDYSQFGRISGSTGVPTVLGWPGHQLQWRGSRRSFDGRQEDVERIYQTLNVEEARVLLAKYGVDYVYVGPREIERYGNDGLDKFSSFMEAIFSDGGVVIYRILR